MRFDTRSCLMLPARFTGCWSTPVNSLAAEAAAKRRSRGAFQLVHHQLSDFGVAFADHGQAVGPTGPVCSLARPQNTPEPHHTHNTTHTFHFRPTLWGPVFSVATTPCWAVTHTKSKMGWSQWSGGMFKDVRFCPMMNFG